MEASRVIVIRVNSGDICRETAPNRVPSGSSQEPEEQMEVSQDLQHPLTGRQELRLALMASL